jgi:hypothetical protein
MPDLENRIQQLEQSVGSLQAILDKTQKGLQTAEVAVHRAKRIPPVALVLLSVTMAVGASLLATWLARRIRRLRNPA